MRSGYLEVISVIALIGFIMQLDVVSNPGSVLRDPIIIIDSAIFWIILSVSIKGMNK